MLVVSIRSTIACATFYEEKFGTSKGPDISNSVEFTGGLSDEIYLYEFKKVLFPGTWFNFLEQLLMGIEILMIDVDIILKSPLLFGVLDSVESLIRDNLCKCSNKEIWSILLLHKNHCRCNNVNVIDMLVNHVRFYSNCNILILERHKVSPHKLQK